MARSAIVGIPYNATKKPDPVATVQAFEAMDARVIANSAGAIIRNSLTALNATTTPAAGLLAWVMGDATVANNGVYENTGTSGAPVWMRRGPLPFGHIYAVNVGAGTADAIEVTTWLPIPTEDGAALITVPIVAVNTSSTVTIEFNGGSPVTVKTNSGNNPAIGGLPIGTITGLKIGSEFRMLSDQASAVIVAAAEAEADRAVVAAAEAEAAAAIAAQKFIPVRVIDTTGAAVATAYENGDTIDGVTLVTGDFVLRSTSGGDPDDGVYIVPASGAASRLTQFDAYDDIPGAFFSVMEGTDNADTLWRCTSNKGGTLGVTNIVISEFSSAGGATGGSYYPGDYGCSLDGTTNDATAFNALLVTVNSAGGGTVDLQGKTMRIDSTITGISNVAIQNGTIDFSNAATSQWLFKFEGVLGSGVAITAASRGAGNVATANTGTVAVGDYVYLRSTSVFGQGGSHNGEFQQVRTVTTNMQLSFYDRLRDLYSGTPQYFHPTMLENIILRDLKIIGGGVGSAHRGVRFYLCRNIMVDNVHTEYLGERAIQFERCVDSTRRAGGDHHCDQTGLSYGTVIGNGNLRASVIGGHYSDLNHAITIGGEDGVDWYVTVSGITATNCKDAALDAHPNACYVTFSNSTIGHLSTIAVQDGIVAQCANVTITGNIVVGPSRVGILVQNLIARVSRADDHAIVSNNQVNYPDGANTSYGIAFECQRATSAWRFTCTGNTINNTNASAAYGIYIEVPTGYGATSIEGCVISGNTVHTRRAAISLVAASFQFISKINITGNMLQSTETATYDCISIAATSANYIERVVITGNVIFGGRYGISHSNGQRIGTGGNMIQAFGTAATNGTLESLGTNFTT